MENPALLLGIPLVALGVVGALVALAVLLSSLQPTGLVAGPRGEAGVRGGHPGPAEYVMVAVALGVVEALELVVYYLDVLGDAALPIMLLLTVIQFALVAMWFMHLKFDSRLFSGFFVGGMLLAGAVFVVVLVTFGASLV